MARTTATLWVLLLVLVAMAAAMEENKLSTDLLRVIHGNTDARVDVMVQLVSPAQALQESCEHADAVALDRAQRASCVAESLQSFADQAQRPVKELLAEHGDLFSDSTFLWISNSVAVKGASGELVLALARLDAVEKIQLEQVIEIQPLGRAI
ncbi:unnamed protein product [Phytophthora lilii]|uniref:Unnamed protein product n=1 Tax=Phytophthora lilii TaxID=2077276 RepID=A0A9W6TKY6_9STRA|nr:unnamed protein product [Phytophthora lilii]